VRLIVHHLAHLCGTCEIDNTIDAYGKLDAECKEKDAARKSELVTAREAGQKFTGALTATGHTESQ
jgi:hypothetical protein